MKLSIITINYNNLDGLRKTMESVFAQTCKDFEYVVIDGASTDGGAEYVKEHADMLTYWVSEKDTGIYNAMNKGIKASKGEYLLMLNSGDYLVDSGVVTRILPELHDDDIIQGNMIEEWNGKPIIQRGYGRSDISFLDAMYGCILHQAAFVKNDLYKSLNGYDERYLKNGDTCFFVEALAFGNATFRYVDIVVSHFDRNGISFTKDPKWVAIGQEENLRFINEHYSFRLWQLCRQARQWKNILEDLQKYPIIWFLTRSLLKLSHFFQRFK